MKKTIEKIKGKGIKLSARIFGAMTACFSTIVAAYADVEDTEAGGVWSNIAAWIKKNKDGLSIVAESLIGLCVVGVVICLSTSGKQGVANVKTWLIALVFAIILLVFVDQFLQSMGVG